MKHNAIARERRRQARLERLGTNTPRCPCCGETDDRVFEAHHIAGRRHDPRTVLLCANCHRKVTDDQKDHPPPSSDHDLFLECVGHFLLGLADLMRLIIDALASFGEALTERARASVKTPNEVQS